MAPFVGAPINRLSHRVRGAGGVPARVRAATSAAVGLIGGLTVAVLAPWWLGPLAGWDCGTLLFLGWLLPALWRADADRTRAEAVDEDPGRAAADALLLGASVVSLLAVGLVLVRAGEEPASSKDLLVGMCVASVILAWSVVHTLYTLRYARLYYGEDARGIDFNEESAPCYVDFAYLALTIGMTFQVSDTDLTTKATRRAAIGHALLSYLFGAIIIAATINLVAGLSH